MGKDKTNLKDLEKETQEFYRILLAILAKIKEIIGRIKKNRAAVQDYVYEYIRLYKLVRSIRLILNFLDKRIKQDEEAERKIREEEDYLDGIIKTYEINITGLGQLRSYYDDPKNIWPTRQGKMDEIAHFFNRLNLWDEITKLGGKAEDKKLGITNLHHELIGYMAHLMVKTKVILRLIGIAKRYSSEIDEWLKEGCLPKMKKEIRLLQANVIDKDLLRQTKLLKLSIQQLEAEI